MKIPSEGGWTFENAEIAGAFDDHVREQLPWYDLATGIVAHLVRHYLPERGLMYDIGASTGNVSRSVLRTIEDRHATVIPIEPSQEMIDLYKGAGVPVKSSAEDFDFQEFDVSVLFLTLMFVPVGERPSLISKLIGKCKPGGCVIIFDKTPPRGGYISTALSRLALAGKVATGLSADEILKKELSLSGCQRPFECNIPGAVEVFRFGDFAGWVIEKEECSNA